MPSSIRIETLEELKRIVVDHGTIEFKKGDREKANQRLEEATTEVEQARKEALMYNLARFPAILFCGSARETRNTTNYRYMTKLAMAVVEAIKRDVVTGGGPGSMEAANLGAYLAIEKANVSGEHLNAKNIGFTITALPTPEDPNPYVDRIYRIREFTRRVEALVDRSIAAYFGIGGFGTMFELVYVLQTKQVGHLEPEYPVLCHRFWKPLVVGWNNRFFDQRKVAGQTLLISEKDLTIIQFPRNIPKTVSLIKPAYDHWWESIGRHVRLIP